MELKDYLVLQDFARVDADDNGRVTRKESHALLGFNTPPTTLEEVDENIRSAVLFQSTGCNLQENGEGDRVWDGLNLFSGSLPKTINANQVAKETAQKYLSATQPKNSEHWQFFEDASEDMQTFTRARMSETFGGKDNFDRLKQIFEDTTEEAKTLIAQWQTDQMKELPGGIELADGKSFCEYTEKRIGELDSQYAEMALKAGRSPAD